MPHTTEGVPKSNAQLVKKGDIVLVHNNGPRVHWKRSKYAETIDSIELPAFAQPVAGPIGRFYPL